MKQFLYTLLLLACIRISYAQSPGNALSFDGSGDYVSAPVPAIFTDIANNDFTVETWILPLGSGTSRILFVQQSSTEYVSLLLNSANVVYVYIGNGSSSIGFNSSTSLTAGQWSHVALTWDASASQANIYINGMLTSLISGGTTSFGTNGLMAIGSKTDGTQNLNGALDEFRIWQNIRTTCQINAVMHNTLTGTEPGLLHYYDFNQGTPGAVNTGITTLPDLAGTADGTLNNFGLSGSSSNWVASGVSITNTGDTPMTNNMSIHICEGDTVLFAGQPLYSSGTYSDTLVSGLGCDSVLLLQLTVHGNPSHTFSESVCGPYNFNGSLLTTSGIYSDTLVSATGCDSIVTLNLTIHTVDTSVVFIGGTQLLANTVGATYQWLNCDQSFMPVPGATSALFTATANGSYAVAITQNNCTDTSACFSINTVGLDHAALPALHLYPNPATEFITLSGNGSILLRAVTLTDMQGRILLQQGALILPVQIDIHTLPAGLYMITAENASGKSTLRLLKK